MEDAAAQMKLAKHCMIIYMLYAVSVVTQLFSVTMVPGLLLLTIAFILNTSKKFKNQAKDTPFASHQRWMSRTFWIGTGLLWPLAMVVAMVIIMNFTEAGTMLSAITAGGDDPDAAMNNAQGIMGQMDKASSINTYCSLPVVIWYLRRCWVGYNLAKIGLPVENVTSWL